MKKKLTSPGTRKVKPERRTFPRCHQRVLPTRRDATGADARVFMRASPFDVFQTILMLAHELACAAGPRFRKVWRDQKGGGRAIYKTRDVGG